MKKQWSSFVSVLLAMTMLISVMVPFTAVSAANTAIQSDNHTRLLTALGVNVDTQKDTVTRADFANYIYQAVRLSDVEFNGEMVYQDVKPDAPYYTAVGVLCQLGVLSKSDRFNPGNIISAPEMAKMMVSVLGYDFVAQEMGGYPYGYILCAQSLGISLSDSTAFTGAMIPDILFEMLEAHPNRPFTANQINVSDTSDGFLVYHNVRPIKGMITANEITSVYQDIRVAGAGQISLDGVCYAVDSFLTDGKRAIADYIGFSIEAYVYDYKGEDEKIIYFDTDDSIFVSLNTADVKKDGFILREQADGREEKHYLSLNVSVILNGKNDSDYTDADFETVDGTMLLIDNNRDGNYDVVNIEKPEYLISRNVQAASAMIADENKHGYGAQNATYLRLDDNSCKYEYFIHDGKQLKPCTLEALESFESFAVVMSRDEQYIRITGFSNVASGNITEYSNEENGTITLGGVTYHKTEYANARNPYVSVGTYATAYLTPENKLIYLDFSEDNMRYGFLMKVEQYGAFGSYAAALLMETGNKEYVYFKDNIFLDGDRVPADFDNRSGVAYNKLSTPYQLIKYSLDKDGKIACIDTATASDKVEQIYTDRTVKDPKNSLVWHTDITEVAREAIMYTTTLVPSIVPRNVKVFAVPKNVNDAAYEFDAEDFEVISVDEISTGAATVRVYDMARNADAGALVYYKSLGADGLPTLDPRSDVAVVSRVANSINEEGIPVKKVSYVTFDSQNLAPSFHTGFFSEELQEEYEKQNYDIGVGDVVLIATSGTTITNLQPHVCYSEWRPITKDDWQDFPDGVGFAPEDRVRAYFYAKGKVLDFSDSVISILVEYNDPNTGVEKSALMAFPIMGVSSLTRYNEHKDLFEEITLSELNTAYNVGLDSADRIVLRTYNDKIKALVIYPAE